MSQRAAAAVLALVLGAAGVGATTGPPARQPAVRAGVACVHAYQRLIAPSLRGHVACRYHPTCSHYAIDAMRARGFWTGGALAVRRIASCTARVPMGTVDRVPGASAQAFSDVRAR